MGNTSQSNFFLQYIQRHLRYEGITSARSAFLLGGGASQWGASTRLFDSILKSQLLKNISRSLLGCLAIAIIYDANSGQLSSAADEVDLIEAIVNVIVPNFKFHQIDGIELGRLALFCLKMKHSGFFSAELKIYCSMPDSPLVNGCFEKSELFGKIAKKRDEYFYTPVCAGVMEFLAALYLVSLANRTEMLAAEIMGLSFIAQSTFNKHDESVEADILKVSEN